MYIVYMVRKLDIDENYFRERSVINPETGCWEWQLFRTATGYGKVGAGHSQYREQIAHRLAYRVLRADGAPIVGEIDHLCRNRSCVNPDHLEDVPHQINMARAPLNDFILRRAHQENCVAGHPYAEFGRVSKGLKYCIACKRVATARYRDKKAGHAGTS